MRSSHATRRGCRHLPGTSVDAQHAVPHVPQHCGSSRTEPWYRCAAVQVVALMYYVMSYFPGGASGVKFMLTVFYKAVLSCMSSVTRMF